uniref:Uncharacterized protein n=1 Tax=Meloidogyne enterolobii TaxID=390850 RepID=A0A6V7W4F8_MELEN|nr:unnamed protein product [Meloidogyne enterolobii]
MSSQEANLETTSVSENPSSSPEQGKSPETKSKSSKKKKWTCNICGVQIKRRNRQSHLNSDIHKNLVKLQSLTVYSGRLTQPSSSNKQLKK